ncbi:MAG: thiolase family protein [Clostridia bacterium]|jgi:acetyl-CoA C-acetyltransferase|nr:thiolase family protein [Clostridia bacterium]
MERVVITGFARTPIGAFLGGLKTVPVQDLATLAVKEALQRAAVERKYVDEVIIGHVISTPEAGNIGRRVALQAGLGLGVTGFTVNRICGSGIQAVLSGAQEIRTGMSEVVVAAGAESLSRVPYYLPLPTRYQGLRNMNYTLYCSNDEYAKHTAPEDIYPIFSMGDTAENIVEKYEISREDSDSFAYRSQMRAKTAMENGRFAKEIIPVEIKTKKETILIDKDEHAKPNTTLEGLAKLKPVFKQGGAVTAGNSSGMNDAAAAVVLMSERKCRELGCTPLAYVGETALDGVDPTIMGMGPVGAIQKLLKKTGLSYEDIDVLEINEAFAAQVLGCMKELGHYIGAPLYDRLNPNGGAVALGHPLGMTGIRLVGTTVFELLEQKARYGIASACIGGGQGIAMLLERYEA